MEESLKHMELRNCFCQMWLWDMLVMLGVAVYLSIYLPYFLI